ncbi:MAG TPA: hypothetical protein VK891_07340 [Euzebyales bacterium]|nr:hypothetical protein [Euzebyales bacterium]
MEDLSSTRVHRPSGRSLTGRVVRLSIFAAVLASAAFRFAVADVGPARVNLLIAGIVGLLVVFVLTVVTWLVRARVEVAADGIRNRVIGGWTHQRWEELADVRVTTRGVMRTVQVVRRDGRVVRLTALRDAPAMPDPDFDDTVEVIRQRLLLTGDGSPR